MVSARSTIRSASLVSAGTLTGQLIAFAGSLILVRIFSPAEMGLFTTIVAISSFISPWASGQIANAAPLADSNRSAVTLVKMAIMSAAIVGLLIGISIFLIITSGIKGNLEGIWGWSLPALIISLAIYNSANQLTVRSENYRGLAIRGVIYPLIMTGTQILLGVALLGASGLILGMIVGHLITAFTLWLPIVRLLRTDASASPSWWLLLQEFRRFPLVLGPAGAINALATQLPQIGVTFFFGLAIGGQFGMMVKILAVPVALIGQSIGFVYAGQIAKARREGEANVRPLFDRLSIVLGGMALVFAGGIILWAEPVFAWLLGETWRTSGEFSRLFILSTAMQLVAAPLSQTLVISERTYMQLFIDLFRALALIVTFIILYFLQPSVNITVFTIGAVSGLSYVVLWALNRNISQNIRPNIVRPSSF